MITLRLSSSYTFKLLLVLWLLCAHHRNLPLLRSHTTILRVSMSMFVRLFVCAMKPKTRIPFPASFTVFVVECVRNVGRVIGSKHRYIFTTRKLILP